MAGSMRVVRNDFPALAAQLEVDAAKVVAATADRVADGMRSRASSRIESTIDVDVQGSRAEVMAGDLSRAIHAGFVEFGTVDTAAQPFAVPAAEAERQDFVRAMTRLPGRR
jgi:hypothetical protein